MKNIVMLATLALSLSTFALFSAVSGAPSAMLRTTYPQLSYPAGVSAPDQSTVALKSMPKTISISDKRLAAALGPKDIAKAETVIAKPAVFEGTVTKTYSPSSHEIVIIDFDPDYHNTITAVAKPENYKKLPALSALTGKTLLLTGIWSNYHGKPQIELKSASQIEIVK